MDLPGQTTDTPRDALDLAPEQLVDETTNVLAATTLGSSDLVTYDTTSGEQTLIVMNDASSPTEYEFAFNLPAGASLSLQPDGSVSIRDANDEEFGTVEEPWAVDAAGMPVDTHFTVTGNRLIQTVTPSSDTTFPVVADPATAWEWTVCIATVGATFTPWGAGAAVAYKLVKRFGSVRRGIEIIWRAYHSAHGAQAKWNAAMAASDGLFAEIIGINEVKEACFS